MSTNLMQYLIDSGAATSSLGLLALAVLAVVVFIESGVLFPFLPGDSLLVSAAVLHADLGIVWWQIILVAGIAAVAGDQVGFWLGLRFGRRLFSDDARVLRTDRLRAAEDFFARHGSLALVLGRFVPMVRTYIPVAAGTADMHYRRFVGWNITGALGWVITMVAVGTLLGQVPGVTGSIDAIMIIIVGVSVLPLVIKAVRMRLGARRELVGAAQE